MNQTDDGSPSFLSRTVVAGQFLCLAAIVTSGPWPRAGLSLLLALCGAGLGGWAVAVMRRTRFRIVPDVHREARLMDQGPYRLLRHPLYTSPLLLTAGFVLAAPAPGRWAWWGALAVDLIIKLHHEERLLRRRFPQYDAYCQRTWRLLPWIY